ncbi:MAG: extracellular solute-binding protein [Lachnospiraceae bacterium]|nr:extracellular solute-binding protein [Lachnospiraceae bacterium]
MNCVSDAQIDHVEAFMEKVTTAFAEQYEAADVTVNLQIFPLAEEEEAISKCFDTEDAADVIYAGYFNMSSYIHTGRVVPLDDIITEEIRDDIDESLWQMSEVGGKTYMMPYLNMQNILIYNKTLFQACGLEDYFGEDREIQTWTIEEWTDILDTLARELPEGTYPMMMYAGNNQGDTHTMSRLRAFGGGIFDEAGNFDFEDERVIQALTWMQEGAGRGWYPPHSENLVIKNCSELFANGQLAIYHFNNANTTLYDDIDSYGFVNYPGGVATMFPNGFEVFDNGDDTKLQAAKDFVRYIYETEELLELSAGNIPASEKVTEKYEDQILMLREFSENSGHIVDFMNNSPNWQGREDSVRSVFWPHIHELLLGTVTPQECAEGLNEDCNAALAAGRKESVLHK